MIAASPATVTLQRFQQMTNRSPRALQLKRQSETMSPRASGENRPPQFRSDERHWLRSDPGHRADGSPGAVLQAVWEPEAEREGMFRWDAVIDGKQWYYDASIDKYYYTVADSQALTSTGLLMRSPWQAIVRQIGPS